MDDEHKMKQYVQERDPDEYRPEVDDIRVDDDFRESDYLRAQDFSQNLDLQNDPSRRNKGNTGPKGVLADYAEAKSKMEARWKREAEETRAKIQGMCFTVKPYSEEEEKELENTLFDPDLDDEAFHKAYREKRIKQLQADSRPTFGFLNGIDVDSFLDIVDKVPSDIFVVIHMYENNIRPCIVVNEYLSKLAMKYSRVSFNKMLASEASRVVDFDRSLLPLLLFYRGGKLSEYIVPVTVELGLEFSFLDIEELLCAHGVIDMLD